MIDGTIVGNFIIGMKCYTFQTPHQCLDTVDGDAPVTR